MLRHLIAILLTLCALLTARAQELNCQVEVNTSQVAGTNTSVFNTLREAVTEYMNTTKFTQAQFSPLEKIECKMFFTVKEYGDDNVVKGDLQVQYTRPVYNANYMTTVLNFRDSKIDFEYREGEPLVFSETAMESQLTAILNFYAYLILALDFDTFAPRGGDPYYERMAQIVHLAQSSGETGWRAFEDPRNRPAVLEALNSPATQSMRDIMYAYHRQGLDQMSLSPDKGRSEITKAVEQLKGIYDVAPMSVGLAMFRDAKLDELVNIYTKGTQDERDRVATVLSSLYPTDNDRIERIRKGDNR